MGLIFILNEIGIKKVVKQFNFLQFFFGKTFFCFFLGLMCFNRHKWFSWACSILFFISGFFYLMLSFIFLKEEKKKLRKIMNKTSSTSSTSSNNETRDVQITQNTSNINYK